MSNDLESCRMTCPATRYLFEDSEVANEECLIAVLWSSSLCRAWSDEPPHRHLNYLWNVNEIVDWDERFAGGSARANVSDNIFRSADH